MKWCCECSKIIHLIFTSTWLKCYMMHWYQTLSETHCRPHFIYLEKGQTMVFFSTMACRRWYSMVQIWGTTHQKICMIKAIGDQGIFVLSQAILFQPFPNTQNSPWICLKKISASKYALRWISFSANINQTPYGIYKIWFLFRNLSAFSISRFDFLKHN